MPHLTTSISSSSPTPTPTPYSWARCPSHQHRMVRRLTNLERMFAVFNSRLQGQNAAFMGAKISLSPLSHPTTSVTSVAFHPSSPPDSLHFTATELHACAVTAFMHTRWRYPSVAARIVDDQRSASYPIESTEEVRAWAERTVRLVVAEGGWEAVREGVSREGELLGSGQGEEGDTCFFYLVVRPGDVAGGMTGFDVLMHTHHTFTDGSGIRVVLNEFLERLAESMGGVETEAEMLWGDEVARLEPGCVDLEREREVEEDVEKVVAVPVGERAAGSSKSLEDERLKGFLTPDIGLPVYRPDLRGLTASMRGTFLECHTFDDPTFLPQLLAVGRKRGIKLTSVLHTTLLRAIYLSLEAKPSAGDCFKSGSPMDLRNGYLLPEYCDRSRYVNSAVAIQPIHVPCELFQENEDDGFWKAAGWISAEWDKIKQKKGLARAVEVDAGNILNGLERSRRAAQSAVVPKPRTCPSFVSDPPGSLGLRGTYPISGYKDLNLVLDSYQLATDQMQAVISTRAHSYNGLLTLCLAFNAARNPRDKMQAFLGVWVEVVRDVLRRG